MGQANRKSKDPAVRRQMAIERNRLALEESARRSREAKAARLAAMTPEEREEAEERERAASLRRSNGRGVLAVAMAFASIFASGSQRYRR